MTTKMIGVTVGIGADVRGAEHAASLFRKHTGLDAVILGEEEYNDSGLEVPHILKLKAFEYVSADYIVYFDADLWFRRPWEPPTPQDGEIIAVRDINWAAHILEEVPLWGLSGRDYFNSGLFIMSRKDHAPVMEMALKLREQFFFGTKTAFMDQTVLNAAVLLCGCPLRFLDRRYNWLQASGKWIARGIDVIGAHKYKAGQSTSDMFVTAHEYEQPGDEYTVEGDRFTEYAGVYRYERVGHDYRLLELLCDGNIGMGQDSWEQWWLPVIQNSTGKSGVILCGADPRNIHNEEPIAFVEREDDGVLKGQWLKFEQMPVHMERTYADAYHGEVIGKGSRNLAEVWDKIPREGKVVNLGGRDASAFEALLRDREDVTLGIIFCNASGSDAQSRLRTSSERMRALRKTAFAGVRRKLLDAGVFDFRFIPRNYADVLWVDSWILVDHMRSAALRKEWMSRVKKGGYLAGPYYTQRDKDTAEALCRDLRGHMDMCENFWYIKKY